MPTDLPAPPPPLDRSMKVWGGLKENPEVLQRTIDILNSSPTAREQIWNYERQIVPGAPGSALPIGAIAGDAAAYNNRDNQIQIGTAVTAPEVIAGSIAHELGHYIDDSNLDQIDNWYGKPGYEGAWVMGRMASEGIAAINNYRILDERSGLVCLNNFPRFISCLLYTSPSPRD